ncbi:hypothetical protein V8F33_010478 [Rhypophila sp. PSN 637]
MHAKMLAICIVLGGFPVLIRLGWDAQTATQILLVVFLLWRLRNHVLPPDDYEVFSGNDPLKTENQPFEEKHSELSKQDS